MNKHCLQLLAFFFVIGVSLSSFAQQPERKERREIPSPENNARRIMKEFKKTFQLEEKDYDKVYELYLKQERTMMPSFDPNGNMPPRRGGMGGPGRGPKEGFGGGMNFPPMGGGMPPQKDFNMGGGRMPEDIEKRMENIRKEQDSKYQKAAKKLSKKMKKILDKEQYNQWLDWESKRIIKTPASPFMDEQ